MSNYFCLRSKIFNYSFIDVVDKWSAFNNAHARHGIVLTSSIFLPHGIVETSFTLLSLTRIIHLFKYSFMTGRFLQVYVSGLDEVDGVMILEETNINIVYILNYYIL